jgi:amino acid permease
MAFWKTTNPAVWITVFFVPPFLFNNFNVRRYGEFEYWLTVIKIVTVIGLIVLGILLPINASSAVRLSGTLFTNDTTPDWQLTQCPANLTVPIIEETKQNGTCVGTPGFGCKPTNPY